MAQAPLVSICLPVFNGERHLAQAVASVLAQTHPNLEILVFDDASTDDGIRDVLAFQDPRIIVRRNERNLGPEANWNLAMASAKGKYIKLFHQDDLLAPDCLAVQVKALEDAPEAVLSFSSRIIIRSDGTRFLTRAIPWPDGTLTVSELVRQSLKTGTNPIGEPSAVLFRKDVSEMAGGFDGSIPYLIDLDYWVRLMAHGNAICTRRPLASFRLSSRQWSAAIGRQQSRQFIAYLEKIRSENRFEISGLLWLRARMMARLNGVIRAFIYRFLVGTSS